jgi:hypothetical protein
MVAFLCARLDEEEAAAKGPPGWRLEHWTAVRYAEKASGRNWRVDAEPRCIVDAVAKEDAEHIARHDPARAMREVAAMRAHIRMWEAFAVNFTHVDETVFEFAKREALEDVLAHDAAVWSGHPDYRPEWKP